jgi:hypothetical protein
MNKSKEEQMRILFDVYNKQCNNRRIEYTAQSEEQSWIVMDGIELSWMKYQGEYQPIFMCGRGYEVDNVYYFKTFAECEKVWLMDAIELDNYIESITN